MASQGKEEWPLTAPLYAFFTHNDVEGRAAVGDEIMRA